MKKLYASAALATVLSSVTACPAAPIEVKLAGLDDKGHIKPEHAYCAPAEKGHSTDGENKSIGISWSKGPEATKSYAIIAVDTEVPTNFDNAGKEGKTIAADMPRRDFYHWVLVNIPPSFSKLEAGADTKDNGPHGKSELVVPYGLRGVNDYAPFMADNPEHKGIYAGYDGPCPPWNDEKIHRYHFKLFALDVEKLPLGGHFTGQNALKAMQGHVLAEGEAVGLYTLNSALKK